MKINLYSFKLQYEFDKIKTLHWGSCVFFVLAIAMEYFSDENGFFYSIFKIMAASGCYYLLTLTRVKLYYSFWTFAALFMIYFVTGIFNSISAWTSFFYLGALVFMGIEMYILLSPIFYPRVNWWEYDFRYRDDIKSEICFKDQCYKGRLSDLRRNAGCLSCFETIDIGEIIEIKAEGEQYRAEVMSRREYSLGRPLHYGIRFISNDKEEKRAVRQLFSKWKSHKKVMMKKKFRGEEQAT